MRRTALATKRFTSAVSSVVNSQNAEFAAKFAVAVNANEYSNVSSILCTCVTSCSNLNDRSRLEPCFW